MFCLTNVPFFNVLMDGNELWWVMPPGSSRSVIHTICEKSMCRVCLVNCVGVPRPPSGSVIRWKDSQDSRAHGLFQWEDTDPSHQGQNAHGAPSRNTQAQASRRPFPLESYRDTLSSPRNDVWPQVQGIANQSSAPEPWYPGFLLESNHMAMIASAWLILATQTQGPRG